jgi:hypothetical protein
MGVGNREVGSFGEERYRLEKSREVERGGRVEAPRERSRGAEGCSVTEVEAGG